MNEQEMIIRVAQDIAPPGAQQNVERTMLSFYELFYQYESALELVKTQLEVLNEGFNMQFQRNPIHNVEARVKSAKSIAEKLEKKGYPVTPVTARTHLKDIAGVRVTCSYLEDIYFLVDLLKNRCGYRTVKEKDYIRNPKPNGYRSYHLIVEVPAYFEHGQEYIPVEIQIRTIAMDFWASLEHQLHYKTLGDETAASTLAQELKECAETIAQTDQRMQEMLHRIEKL